MTADSNSDSGKLLDAEFGRLAIATVVFFLAMGATFPVVPRFADDVLGLGDTGIGAVLGTMAIGAIVARPFIGRVGDSSGRRTLIIAGAVISAVAICGHAATDSVVVISLLRALFGVGQGAVIVGATTIAVDLAPDNRSGEATSYVFVALHVGSAIGALCGEWVLRTWGFDQVWFGAAAAMCLSALLARSLHEPVAAGAATSGGPAFHRQALLPGLLLGLGALGFVGFNAFVPLFGEEIGVERVAPHFFLASITVVMVRFFGARLPDRLGAARGASVAMVGAAIGLVIIGFSEGAVMLGVGTVVLSAGQALHLPSLVQAAVDGVPLHERSRAMATYTLFLDVSSAVGSVLFGSIAAASDYGSAFLVAAVIAAITLVLVNLTLPRRSVRS